MDTASEPGAGDDTTLPAAAAHEPAADLGARVEALGGRVEALAQQIAVSEDGVAHAFEDVARMRPADADRLERVAQEARSYADHVRGYRARRPDETPSSAE